MRALDTAATGLKAMSQQVDIIANNLANINTTGFKRSRAQFQDLFYQQLRPSGVINSQGEINPSGIQIGLGSQLSSTDSDFSQGDFENTGQPLDVAISGRGFFMTKISSDVGEGIGYTRDGHFFVNAQGNMVQGGPDGFLLDPPITIPLDYTAISITPDGTVNVTQPGSATPTSVGTIQLANFTNPAGLTNIGGNLYVRNSASGDPTISNPQMQGAGSLTSQFLEKSNVDPVRELTNMIEAQRAFELNGRVIEAGDQMLQTVSNLKTST
jgi:flagellar basal-body rod protein FlgG